MSTGLFFRIGLVPFTSVQYGAILQIKLLPYANSKLYASPKVYDESRVRQMCKEITFFDACMFNKNNGADKNARKPYTCRPNHEKWMKSTQKCTKSVLDVRKVQFSYTLIHTKNQPKVNGESFIRRMRRAITFSEFHNYTKSLWVNIQSRFLST